MADKLPMPVRPGTWGGGSAPFRLALVLVVGALLVGGVAAPARAVPSTPGVTVSVGDASGLEPAGGLAGLFVPVTLSGPSAVAVTVTFWTVAGTATENVDYSNWGRPSAPRSITIPAGSRQSTINVPVRGDAQSETNESFTVVLGSAVNAAVGRGAGTATIVDASVGALVSSVGVPEGNTAGLKAQFRIQFAAASAQPRTVAYSSSDGTATAPVDYTAVRPYALTFAAGQTSKTVDVAVAGDVVHRGTRTFTLRTTGSVVGTGTATILEDDPVPPITTVPTTTTTVPTTTTTVPTTTTTVPTTTTTTAVPNSAPSAVITNVATSGLSVDLSGLDSADPDGSVVAYYWNFGDGATSSSPSPSHTYAAGGSYSVTLTVSDNKGLTGSTALQITVSTPTTTTVPTTTTTTAVPTTTTTTTTTTVPPAPTLSHLWQPNWGGNIVYCSGSVPVYLIGSGFRYATRVDFGGAQVPRASWYINSDTQITLWTPYGHNSTYPITVTSPGGTSNPAYLTFYPWFSC